MARLVEWARQYAADDPQLIKLIDSRLKTCREAALIRVSNPGRIAERYMVLLDQQGRPLKAPTRTSPCYWAAFTLSGDWR